MCVYADISECGIESGMCLMACFILRLAYIYYSNILASGRNLDSWSVLNYSCFRVVGALF